MCGIVGYTGLKQADLVLVPALQRLEYRGYDSAGLATIYPVSYTHLTLPTIYSV